MFGAWGVGGLARRSLCPGWYVGWPRCGSQLTSLPIAAAVGVAVPFVTSWWLAGLALIVWGVFYQLVVINSITYRQYGHG